MTWRTGLNSLFVYPETPASFWSFKDALKFVAKKAPEPPLGLITVAAMLPQKWEKKLVDLNVSKLEDRQILWADYVFLSGMNIQINSFKEVIRRCNKLGVKIVVGGPLATTQHKDFLGVDHFILNEAEITLPLFLKDLKNGNPKPVYASDEFPEITSSPVPMWELLEIKKYAGMSMQYSRGCPYDCDFCVVPKIRPGYLKRPIKEVITEIKQLKARLILFLDSSPIEDKVYIKELYRQLIPLKIKWMGLATTKINEDEELLDLAVQSGCSGLLIGFESVSQKSLDGIKKRHNSIEKYEKIIETLHSKNIAIMGCFVFGLENDDKSCFKETVDFIIRTGIDLPRFTVYTPYPGTYGFDKMKKDKRILSEDWSKYDCQNIIFKPKNMTIDELQKGHLYAWKECYSIKNIIKRMLKSKARPLTNLVANIGYKKYAAELIKNRGKS